MNTKHKHYEYIVAFAEGKTVQWKGKDLDSAWDSWEDMLDCHLYMFTEDCYMFRIKPEQKKTVGYRRYVYKNPYNGKYYVHITQESYAGSGSSSDPEFLNSMDVEWIDTEWQHDVVEEGRW